MTTEGTTTEDRVIGRFQKNSNASIQVTEVAWQGKTYLDVREVVPNENGYTYTKKGVRINAGLVGQLLDLLHQVNPDSR